MVSLLRSWMILTIYDWLGCLMRLRILLAVVLHGINVGAVGSPVETERPAWLEGISGYYERTTWHCWIPSIIRNGTSVITKANIRIKIYPKGNIDYTLNEVSAGGRTMQPNLGLVTISVYFPAQYIARINEFGDCASVRRYCMWVVSHFVKLDAQAGSKPCHLHEVHRKKRKETQGVL